MTESSTVKFPALAGATLCLTGVAFGAFGAHALEDLLMRNQRTDVFELAVRYQFYHGLGLLVIACLFKLCAQGQPAIVWLMLVGTLIFSGSLYTLALTNIGLLGAITPVGGTLMIVAWVLLVRFTWRSM